MTYERKTFNRIYLIFQVLAFSAKTILLTLGNGTKLAIIK